MCALETILALTAAVCQTAATLSCRVESAGFLSKKGRLFASAGPQGHAHGVTCTAAPQTSREQLALLTARRANMEHAMRIQGCASASMTTSEATGMGRTAPTARLRTCRMLGARRCAAKRSQQAPALATSLLASALAVARASAASTAHRAGSHVKMEDRCEPMGRGVSARQLFQTARSARAWAICVDTTRDARTEAFGIATIQFRRLSGARVVATGTVRRAICACAQTVGNAFKTGLAPA